MGLIDLLSPVLAIIDKVIPDPAAKAAAQLEVLKLQQNGELAQLASDTQLAQGQMDTNKVEASSESLFKSGWRPAVGWVCVLAFAAKYLGGPLIFVASQYFGITIVLPPIDTMEMMPILFGMLGLGAYRSFDKLKGSTS